MPNIIRSGFNEKSTFVKIFMKYFTNIHKNKTYNIIIRMMIVFVTYYYIYKEVFQKKRGDEEVQITWQTLVDYFSDIGNESHTNFFITWIFLLMIVNWGIESLKWQYLIGKVEKIPFLKSFEAVLSGVSVSVFTPNRVGEWFGRVFILKKVNPWKGVFITMIGSFSQLLTTFVVGSISFLFYFPIYFKDVEFYSQYLYYGIILVVLGINAALLLIFLNISVLPAFANKILKERFIKAKEYFSVISDYSTGELITVFIFSFLRYCVFSLQFYLFLMLFSIEIPLFHGLMIISLVYFIMTAIPTVTLTELGIRGAVSVYFISQYFITFGEYSETIKFGIFASSFALWIVNLALPALIGTIFVFRLKFFRRRKNG